MDMDEFVLTERKTYTLELPKVEYPNNINVYYLRMDGNSLKQYRYTVETNDENKNHVFLLMPVRVGTSPVKIAVKNEKGSKSDPESKDGKFIVGDRVTVYGEYTEPVVYETETGLSMTTPQIMVEMINGDCYNKELKSLVVKDLTDR